MEFNVGFKKLHKDAKLPSYAKPGDAGLDLFTTGEIKRILDKNGLRLFYGTGIAAEIPRDHVGLLFPRSSITTKTGLTLGNSVGVIDSSFRGEIIVAFNVYSKSGKIYEKGDAIAQLIIMPYPKINPVELEELSVTERGIGGFGSSGDGKERK